MSRGARYDREPEMAIDPSKRYAATLDTSHGVIEAELLPEHAPRTVNSFVFLAREGFYDGVTFHRIIPGFVIQGGDPQGTGMGGPGYKFADELPRAGRYEIGSLAMVNAGPNTNGSQFFIICGMSGMQLPPQYSLFGKVVDGLDTVLALERVGSPGAGVPKERVYMESVTITES